MSELRKDQSKGENTSLEPLEAYIVRNFTNSEIFWTQNLEFLNSNVYTGLISWVKEKLSLSNLNELSKSVYPLQVENAIDCLFQIVLDGTIRNAEFDWIAKDKLSDWWLPVLQKITKIVSDYSNKIQAKLDLYRCLASTVFDNFTKELLQKYLDDISRKDAILHEIIELACTRMKHFHHKRNTWVLENDGSIMATIAEAVKTYREEISKNNSTIRQELLKFHDALKDKCIRNLNSKLAPGAVVNCRIPVGYIVQLVGLLNKEFDHFMRTNIAKSESMIVEVSETHDNPINLQIQSTERSPSNTHKTAVFGRDRHFQRVGNTSIYYDNENILSRGLSSIVYKGAYGDEKLRHLAAIKRYVKLDLFDTELKTLTKIDVGKQQHPNVVTVYGYIEEESYFYLAMELADKDLDQRILELKKQNGETDIKHVISKNFDTLVGYFCDVARGLNWLHTNKVLHRDIKPKNILIFSYNNSKKEIAKLTDFGISRILKDSDSGMVTSPDGTEDWVAPEVLKAKKEGITFQNTRSQDIFSLGLTAYYTLTLGDHPFAKSRKRGIVKAWNILDGNVRPARLPHLYCTADDLIRKLLIKDPINRPNSSEILKHPLFWSVEKSLNFLIDFDKIFYEKGDEAINQFRETVDDEFNRWHTENVSQSISNDNSIPLGAFNWWLKLDDDKQEGFMQRKISKGKKDYQHDSLMSLLDLIRDKHMHPRDLVDKLLSDKHFGKNGIFNAEQYGEYFLTTFPEILAFLVGVVYGHNDRYRDLQQLVDKYF